MISVFLMIPDREIEMLELNIQAAEQIKINRLECGRAEIDKIHFLYIFF